MTTLIFALLAGSSYAQQAYFMGLGDLPGGEFRSQAVALSPDGSVVIGTSRVGTTFSSEQAFRWTRDTGMVALGSIGNTSSVADMSADGLTIIGSTGNNIFTEPINSKPYRWTKSGGMEILGLPSGFSHASANRITADGDTIYGSASDDGFKIVGVRWTNLGAEDLSTVIGLSKFHIADVSTDGSMIAGINYEPRQGFVWSQTTGVQIITQPEYPNRPCDPVRISADGSTVVGNFLNGGGFRWSAQRGLVPLENLPDGSIPGAPSGVSADGSIIIGRLYDSAASRPWIWDQLHGTRYLDQALISDYGLASSLTGWTLDGIYFDISGDGRTIVGRGFGPRGLEGFIAYLGTPVPEPSTLLLAAMAILPLAWRRRTVRNRDCLRTDIVQFAWLTFVLMASLAAAPARANTFGSGANTFDIDFVTIGNPGNTADTTGTPNPAGAVSYVYAMGKYEISRDMITKANNVGNLMITLADMTSYNGNGANKPATGVSWNEAARFVNWLNTSTGSRPAYKFALQPGEVGYNANANIELWTISDAGYNPNNLYRNSLATYFLPSVDEWYKAAYYDPANGVYYDYPTSSDNEPSAVASGTAAGTAVYFGQLGPADIMQSGRLSPFGTMGQGGNVWEWEETDRDLVNGPLGSSSRGLRGGHANVYDWLLLSMIRAQQGSMDEPRQLQTKAEDWIAENSSNNQDLLALSAEAEGLVQPDNKSTTALKSAIYSNQD